MEITKDLLLFDSLLFHFVLLTIELFALVLFCLILQSYGALLVNRIKTFIARCFFYIISEHTCSPSVLFDWTVTENEIAVHRNEGAAEGRGWRGGGEGGYTRQIQQSRPLGGPRTTPLHLHP